MDGKIRHRPTTFIGVQDLKRLFSSPNYSTNEKVRIYSAAQTLFSVQLISRVLEFQITSIFFPGKIRQFPRIFMGTVGSNSDVSNDILFRQKDKDFHQVKSWSPTQQLVIKSIVSNFGP